MKSADREFLDQANKGIVSGGREHFGSSWESSTSAADGLFFVTRQVLPIPDEDVVQKIHQNFRILFLKDALLRPMMDDAVVGTLNSLTFFNNAEILQRCGGFLVGRKITIGGIYRMDRINLGNRPLYIIFFLKMETVLAKIIGNP